MSFPGGNPGGGRPPGQGMETLGMIGRGIAAAGAVVAGQHPATSPAAEIVQAAAAARYATRRRQLVAADVEVRH